MERLRDFFPPEQRVGNDDTFIIPLDVDDDDILEDLMDLLDDDEDEDEDGLSTEEGENRVSLSEANGEREMEEALARVDVAEKREYEQALEEVPELVELESPWEAFLWTEDYDSYRAAVRLARYWKARKRYFGDERWLRPLQQTGSGALWPTDVEILKSGYFVMLIRPSGGVVALADFSRMPIYSEHAMVRLMFYINHLFHNESRKGYTCITLENGDLTASKPLTEEAQMVYVVAFPVKIHQCKIYVVQACFEPGKEALMDYVTHQGSEVIRQTTKNTVNRILGQSIHQTFQYLQIATGGMERECLPLSVGGTYDYNVHFKDWLRERMSIEFAQLHPQRVGRSSCMIAPMPPYHRQSIDESEKDDGTSTISSRDGTSDNSTTTYTRFSIPISIPPKRIMHPPMLASPSTVSTEQTTISARRQADPMPLYWIDYRDYSSREQG